MPFIRSLAPICVLLPAAAGLAQQYTLIELGTLPGVNGAAAYAVNERGWVTGNSREAFLWKPETGMTPLHPLPGGPTGAGHDINFAGVVAGESDTAGAPRRAVRWTTPQAELLPNQFSNTFNAAHGVNDHGDIVGTIASRATLWRTDGTVLDLGVLPGDTISFAYDINNAGVVVGQSGNQETSRAFRWNAATGMVPLPMPFPDLGAAARAVNENGDAVGWAYQRVTYPQTQTITVYRAAFWPIEGGFVDLGEPIFPGVSSWADDINDHRQIVGYTVDQLSEAPWIWTQATGYIDLRTRIQANSGFRLRQAKGINNAGQIVGEGVVNESRVGAFLLNPVGGPPLCYPNCDGSTAAPVLNVQDFGCFLSRYAAADPWANCDQSTTPPVLNVADFSCFLTSYAAGCP